jgi:hypothetical protein
MRDFFFKDNPINCFGFAEMVGFLVMCSVN